MGAVQLSQSSSGTRARDRPSLAAVVSTELVRLRHGFLFWYTLLAPVVATVPLYIGSARSSEARAGQYWEVFRNVSLELWGVLVPISVALAAALSVRADGGAWRLMLSYGVPRWRYLTGKFVALAVMQLASATVLALLLAVGAALRGRLADDVGTVLAGAYLPCLAGLATLGIALYGAIRWGLGAAIVIGVAGMLCGALVSDKTIWAAVPMAWPMRVIIPLAGIGANGVPLAPDSPLRDTGVIPVALALSAAITVLALLLGSHHLRRKQI